MRRRGLLSLLLVVAVLVPLSWSRGLGVPTIAAQVIACVWTGTWDTTFGEMHLSQRDSTVTGDYAWAEGEITGTVTGAVLTGTWTEGPFRQPPDEADAFAFTMADDCQSFAGAWGYGFSGELDRTWLGQRQRVNVARGQALQLKAARVPEPPSQRRISGSAQLLAAGGAGSSRSSWNAPMAAAPVIVAV